jgi:predicted anti-sigma-YlaC factor YlaD
MKKICSEIQEEILSSEDVFSTAIEKHCVDCASCRQVKQDWQLLSQIKPEPEIALTNDFAVIRAAQKFSRSQRLQITIRRSLGYAAATASGIAAIYTVMFHGPLPNAANDVLRKSWNWDTFEERIFVLDTAAEVSKQDITIGTSKDEALNTFIENEIIIEQI